MQKKDTGYSVTWHGSDIHSRPFNYPSAFNTAKAIIEDADINFFVSKALLNTSGRITTKGNKQVLYNGCNTRFRRYPDKERSRLRKKYNVEGKKVVVFAGNFFCRQEYSHNSIDIQVDCKQIGGCGMLDDRWRQVFQQS